MIVYEPKDKVLVPVNVTVVLGFTGVNGLVPKTTVVPPGFPVADNVTGFRNPPLKDAVKVVCIEAGAGHDAGAGAGAFNVNPDDAGITADQIPLP